MLLSISNPRLGGETPVKNERLEESVERGREQIVAIHPSHFVVNLSTSLSTYSLARRAIALRIGITVVSFTVSSAAAVAAELAWLAGLAGPGTLVGKTY